MNSGRINVNVFDIMRIKAQNAPIDKIISFGPDFMEYRPELYKSLYFSSNSLYASYSCRYICSITKYLK